MLLHHAGSSRLNDLNPANRQTGLIHEAASGNSVWVVEELVRRGADPNLRSGPAVGSLPALVYHILQRHLDTAKALLHNGADPTEQNPTGMDCVLAASRSGCSSFLEELARADGEYSWRIDSRRTCTFPRDRVRPHASSISGLGALHLGAYLGHVDCLRFYLDRQLPVLEEIDCLTSDGHTPLLAAAVAGRVREVDYLCRKGVQIDFQYPTTGKTASHLAALEHAVRSGHLELCKEVRARGCPLDVDLACGGCSPLILATRNGKFDIVRWLLENGASTTKISCRRRPYVDHNHSRIVFYLSERPTWKERNTGG
ncbi:ankyrin repeat-containing domain protein [Dichotomopilus funicola]|uniref:Ankyrin repeat-containing domain protein n=1 Tax=Dichotomopilus funicola TaxID=1934379 RepID=A0AAN6V5I2_9PEZI|nr:ankyrin repeat-containing domain protein [Dichotomopilus funicola]